MMAHITYLSEEALTRKFGRRMRRGPAGGQGPEGPVSTFGDIFEVESYLRYQAPALSAGLMPIPT